MLNFPNVHNTPFAYAQNDHDTPRLCLDYSTLYFDLNYPRLSPTYAAKTVSLRFLYFFLESINEKKLFGFLSLYTSIIHHFRQLTAKN